MKLKAVLKAKTKLINLLVPEDELKAIDEKAKLYADGNRSAWMRYAAINYKPKKSELEKDGESEA